LVFSFFQTTIVFFFALCLELQSEVFFFPKPKMKKYFFGDYFGQ